MSFHFLRELYAPQKIGQHEMISHKIIHKLIEIDTETDFDELKELKILLEKLVKIEEKFAIAKTEYEKKENRFINNTRYSETQLEHIYITKSLLFKDINSRRIAELIDNKYFAYLIDELKNTINIIIYDTEICYKRIDILINEWKIESKKLLDNIRSFEYKGLKYLSNNLRIKLIPLLKEYKISLQEEMTESTMSRLEIYDMFNKIIREAIEDIYGELTDRQINMLENINSNLQADELIDIISNDQDRADLIYLLNTGKIKIKLTRVIDDLY